MTVTKFTCSRCSTSIAHPDPHTTGYGVFHGRKVCYPCCADIDRRWMDRHDRIALYLVKEKTGGWRVTNWPGSLQFTPWCVKEGAHNLGGIRWDAWFKDHQGRPWHGVSIGRWTQILHARRIKG